MGVKKVYRRLLDYYGIWNSNVTWKIMQKHFKQFYAILVHTKLERCELHKINADFKGLSQKISGILKCQFYVTSASLKR